MGLISRWLNIGGPSKKDFEDLTATVIEALARAKDAHISDLRLLIDKGQEREASLSRMIELAMEHQFYRPVITGGNSSENKVGAALPPEAMTDVAVFDEESDGSMIKAQNDELARLMDEQNAHKAARLARAIELEEERVNRVEP